MAETGLGESIWHGSCSFINWPKEDGGKWLQADFKP